MGGPVLRRLHRKDLSHLFRRAAAEQSGEHELLRAEQGGQLDDPQQRGVMRIVTAEIPFPTVHRRDLEPMGQMAEFLL